jgi:hypothetical protein
MASTKEILINMMKNDLCRAAKAQGKELSPQDISDKNPNLIAAILADAPTAKAIEIAKDDPTHANLLRMNRFDEYCNTLASSKTTYDLYKRLQERALPMKSRAIANHESYEALLKEIPKLLDYLSKTLTQLADNILQDKDVTPEVKEQIKQLEQERKKFSDTTLIVGKDARETGFQLDIVGKEASEAAIGKTLGATPSAEGPG